MNFISVNLKKPIGCEISQTNRPETRYKKNFFDQLEFFEKKLS